MYPFTHWNYHDSILTHLNTCLLAIYIKIRPVSFQAFEVLKLKYSILLGYCAPSLCVEAS